MRILICGINFYPELTGIGKYTGEMAQYLSQYGHEVRVVTAPPYYPYWQVQIPYHAWHYQREKWSGVNVYRCPLWVPRKPSGFMRLLHLFSFVLTSFPVILMQKTWKPEIIVVIAPSLFSAVPALLFSKLVKAKTWLHVQDFELDAAFGLGLLLGGKQVQEIAQKMEAVLMKRFDRVSTISNRMLERLWQKGVEKGRTVLFPNWIDTEVIKPLLRPSQFRREWGIGDNQVVILYAGNMGRKQGLDLLLSVARLLVGKINILFVLCGDGAERGQLQIEVQDLPNVRFYPLQPYGRLNELLNLADIHILPQRADAADLVMPSKLSGMLASEKPVIATAYPETELGSVILEVGILTNPGDISGLANAIVELAEASPKRIILGQKGRNWVLGQWSKEKVLGRFQSNLQDMVESTKSSGG